MYDTGIVHLVGAGPGDPGLLTRRGADLLARADAVVFEPPAPVEMLELCGPDCLRIEAGRAASGAPDPKPVHERLIELAEEGKTVVRLHREDPFVFGQGVEEAKALSRAGIPFEVVPGVSLGLAAPAYAGIPLVHQGGTSRFTVVGEEYGALPDFRSLAREEGAIVFHIAAERLGEMAEGLLAGGMDPGTWTVIIDRGGLPAQRVIESALEKAPEAAELGGLSGPIVAVVGEAGRLRWELNWFEGRPLHGRRILVTRPREQAGELADRLEEAGAEVLIVPTIRIAPPEDAGPLDEAIGRLGDYDWAMFTSANGVRFFADRLRARGLDARAFAAGCRILAVGPGTARALEERLRLRADLVPERYVAEGAIEALEGEDLAGKRVLIPRAAEARETLPLALRERGAEVDAVPAYRSLPGEAEGAARLRRGLAEGEIDMVTFTSGSTVRNFVEMVGAERLPEAMGRAAVASIGPVTSEAVREAGLPLHVEAHESTVRALAREIADFYRFHPAMSWGSADPLAGDH
ncbi:MAG: uroporphyrinogen-III synthase [bacterium]